MYTCGLVLCSMLLLVLRGQGCPEFEEGRWLKGAGLEEDKPPKQEQPQSSKSLRESTMFSGRCNLKGNYYLLICCCTFFIRTNL